MRLFKKFTAPALIVGLIAAGMGIGFYTAGYYDHVGSAEQIDGFFWPNPKQIYPFVTVDHNGNTFNLERLQGKWSFIFFGYTHCPDICPITLSVLKQVYEQLQATHHAGETQILFVTADPERDTPEQLEKYVTYFNEDFIGLGGNPPQIQSLAIQLGAVALAGEAMDSRAATRRWTSTAARARTRRTTARPIPKHGWSPFSPRPTTPAPYGNVS